MNNVGTKIWNILEGCIKYIAYNVLKLKLSDALWNNLMQFVKFGIVGLSNTVIGYLIYAITLKGLRIVRLWPTQDIFVAQLVMFLISVAWSFYWNNKAVFKQEESEHRNVLEAILKTYISYAFTSLFLAEVLLYFWVKVCHINEYVAPILSLIVTIPLNFILQKYLVFGKSKGRLSEN